MSWIFFFRFIFILLNFIFHSTFVREVSDHFIKEHLGNSLIKKPFPLPFAFITCNMSLFHSPAETV